MRRKPAVEILIPPELYGENIAKGEKKYVMVCQYCAGHKFDHPITSSKCPFCGLKGMKRAVRGRDERGKLYWRLVRPKFSKKMTKAAISARQKSEKAHKKALELERTILENLQKKPTGILPSVIAENVGFNARLIFESCVKALRKRGMATGSEERRRWVETAIKAYNLIAPAATESTRGDTFNTQFVFNMARQIDKKLAELSPPQQDEIIEMDYRQLLENIAKDGADDLAREDKTDFAKDSEDSSGQG